MCKIPSVFFGYKSTIKNWRAFSLMPRGLLVIQSLTLQLMHKKLAILCMCEQISSCHSNQPETLVAATLGTRLVILVQEPILGMRLDSCVAIVCRIASHPLWLRVWGCQLGERRELVHKSCQPLSAAVDNAGCQVSGLESLRLVQGLIQFTLTYARQLAFDSSLPDISLSIGQPCWGGCWILLSSPSSLPPLPSPTRPPSCRVTTN